MCIPPINWHEIVAPVAAGTVVSLLNKFVFNNPDLYNFVCCQQVNNLEHETMDDKRENSGNTIASVDEVRVHHGVPFAHAVTVPHFTN